MRMTSNAVSGDVENPECLEPTNACMFEQQSESHHAKVGLTRDWQDSIALVFVPANHASKSMWTRYRVQESWI